MGTLTITTTAQQDARIVAAFGRRLGLGRNATGAEVRENIVQFVRDVVEQQERDAAALAAMDAVTPVDVE